MKAVVIEAFGGTDVLKIAEIERPVPAANEILVEVHASSVNPVDWKTRDGTVAQRARVALPIVLGWDVAGIVRACGADVQNFAIGDAVYGMSGSPGNRRGAYAEYATLDAATTTLKPKTLSMEEAAALPLAGLTAWQSLYDVLNLTATDTLFIQGGAGGVGSMAVQFAKNTGAKIYTTARTTNHDYVRELGADTAIDYTLADVVETMKRLEPSGVDCVFDAVGGADQSRLFEILKPGGKLCSITGAPDLERANQYKVSAAVHRVRGSADQLQEIGNLFEQGRIKMPAYTVMPLAEIAAAHRQSETGHVRGKIVLKIK